jgi:serine/threonine-protein kinase
LSEKATPLEGPEKLLGSRVLDFELKSIIGSGGMSVVYRGQHRVTGQEVAIKILPPELAVHEELKARFVEEARVLAKLEHPNIVHLNNFTETSGRLCLIMQFVDGVTFESLIFKNGRVPVDEAVKVGIEVCRALEYAHQHGVVHRDIKPSNVIVRADGSIKVTDFGIAKMIGNTRLTSTGQTMGTVRYMSPEQVRGKQADARSDIYSLGVTLYEALCGKTPFDGDSHFDIMQQHLKNKPQALAQRLKGTGVTMPPAVERAVARALAKNAGDRPADAAELRVMLERALTHVHQFDDHTTLSGRRRQRGARLAGTLGLVVLLVGIAGGTVLTLRHLTKRAATPQVVVKRDPPQASWPAPHTLPATKLAVDELFKSDGLRVQSVGRRDATAVRDAYRDVLGKLGSFLSTNDAPAPASKVLAQRPAPPLNLVIVPQAMLDDQALWPDLKLTPGSTYRQRYVAKSRTLFINDSSGWTQSELPYGVATHVLTPVAALSNDDIVRIAEKFEDAYSSKPER